MEFFKHSNCNTVIVKPSDMTDEQCGALPAMIWRDQEGPWACSFWRPNAEELAALVAGGSIGVNLRVGPGQHPVMYVSTYAKEPVDG